MSFRTLNLLTVWALPALAVGCASGPTQEDLRRAHAEELRQQQKSHDETLAGVQRQLEVARDDVRMLRNTLERHEKELIAARSTSKQHKLSLEVALTVVRRKEQELETLKKRADTPQTAQEAAQLLLASRREIKTLRDEIARLHAGKPRANRNAGPAPIVTVADLDFDKPVGAVDGVPITRREFVEYIYRDMGAPKLLDLYINRRLLLAEAKRRQLKVTDVDVELWVARRATEQERQAGGSKKLGAKLTEMGFTRDAWLARLKFQARPSILLKRLVDLNRRSSAGEKVFTRRIQAAYHEAYSEQVLARHIYIKADPKASPARHRAAERRASLAHKQVARGIAFEKVAKLYSDDPKSRGMGGLLGKFDRQKFANLPQLNNAFFTLPKGKVSAPIRSRVGYHVVLVEERFPPAKQLTPRVRAQLAKRLRSEPPGQLEVELLLRKLRTRARINSRLTFD